MEEFDNLITITEHVSDTGSTEDVPADNILQDSVEGSSKKDTLSTECGISIEINKPSSEVVTDIEDEDMETETEFSSEIDWLSVETVQERAKPSDAALTFLDSVTEKMIEFCCFEDKLLMTSDDGTSAGEYRASVEETQLDGQKVLFIRAYACGEVNGTPTTSNLTAYLLLEKLTLLEQEHRQYYKTREGLEILTSLKLDRETQQLIVQRKITNADAVTNTNLKFNKNAINGLIPEATNIILQRLLVKANVDLENMDL